MDFNFRDSFQSYSNVELLKIVKQADRYQPEAVAAAQQILSSREVHDSDYDQVNRYHEAIAAKQEQQQEYKEELSDFLEAMVKPDEHPQVNKWVNILVIVLILQYLWTLSNSVKSIDFFLQQERWYSITYGAFISLTYPLLFLPPAIYLLYTRKRWGWILITAYYVGVAASQLVDIFSYLYYVSNDGALYPVSIGSLLTSLLIRGGFVFFLLRPYMTALFGISKRAMRDTVVIGVCIGLTIYTLNFAISYATYR